MPQASLIASATVLSLRPQADPSGASDKAARLPLILLRELQHRTANVLHFAQLLLEVNARRSEPANSRVAFQEVAASFRLLIEANQRFTVPVMDTAGDAAMEIRAAFTALSVAHARARPGVRFDCVIAADARFSVRPAGVLSLIVNELVTNAFKHAFSGRETGYLLVTLMPASDGRACLTVLDDGPGFTASSPASGHGRGIVDALAEAIDGEVSFSDGGSQGGKVRVTFLPVREHLQSLN